MSDLNSQLDFINQSVTRRIEGIKGRIKYYRKVAFWTYFGSAILAALISFLLGVNATDKSVAETIRLITLVISCSLSVLAAYNAFYSHKEMWIANNEALNDFYSLKFEIDFYLSGGADISQIKIEELIDKYQTFLKRLNDGWTKSRANIPSRGN